MKFSFLHKSSMIILIFIFAGNSAFGFKSMSKKAKLDGPWELVVKMGFEDGGLVFPLEIKDRDKTQELKKSMPLLGTPVVVSLKKYYPDYRQENNIVADPNGGSIASIAIKGEGLDQELLLIAGDPQRRSISAKIGGVAIRDVNPPGDIKAFLKEIADKKAIGVLSFFVDDKPVDVIIGKNGKYKVPGSKYTVEVVEYMSHYSIDRKTKKVKNASPLPTNPAVRIRLSDGQDSYEKWIWSRFAIAPHSTGELPVKVVFNDFDLANSEGRYIIVQEDGVTWLNYIENGKRVVEKGGADILYPFDKSYAFMIKEIKENASIKPSWGNKSEKLLNPAVLIDVIFDGVSDEVLVSFEKPTHLKTEYGTLVIYYRKGIDQDSLK